VDMAWDGRRMNFHAVFDYFNAQRTAGYLLQRCFPRDPLYFALQIP
jgi:hypothetical protein